MTDFLKVKIKNRETVSIPISDKQNTDYIDAAHESVKYALSLDCESIAVSAKMEYAFKLVRELKANDIATLYDSYIEE